MPRKTPNVQDLYISACDGKTNMSVAQAAVFLGCSANHVHHLASGQHLHPVRVSGVLVFSRGDLARYRRIELELEIARELQRGTHPLDVFFTADGRYGMAEVERAMREWSKLTGCWVVEAPRGSYARWLERVGVQRVSPRQIRRFIEGMLTDAEIGVRARAYFADQRTADGIGLPNGKAEKSRRRKATQSSETARP